MAHAESHSPGAPRAFALQGQIRRFLEAWSDPRRPLDELLGVLHPLAFDLQLPEGRARGKEALRQIRRTAAERPMRPSYLLKRLGPARETSPPGGFRVAAQVAIQPGDHRPPTPPVGVVFEFRRTLQGDFRIARVQPAI